MTDRSTMWPTMPLSVRRRRRRNAVPRSRLRFFRCVCVHVVCVYECWSWAWSRPRARLVQCWWLMQSLARVLPGEQRHDPQAHARGDSAPRTRVYCWFFPGRSRRTQRSRGNFSALSPRLGQRSDGVCVYGCVYGTSENTLRQQQTKRKHKKTRHIHTHTLSAQAAHKRTQYAKWVNGTDRN